MYTITISNMQNSGTRSFEFNDFKTAILRFNEYMDANNIHEFLSNNNHEDWLSNPLSNGEFQIANVGGIGHDVRIELNVTKPFAPIASNDILHLDRVKSKMYELGARLVAINDDVNMEFWQFENRMFILQTTGREFQLFCSMEFPTLDSAIRQIENICRTQKFMA